MLAYIIRRLLLGIPTLLGVLFILFSLFYWIASPKNIALRSLGEKATSEQVEEWIKQHGYDKPKFFHAEAEGLAKITDTRLVHYYKDMLSFNFGKSDLDDVLIIDKIKAGGPISFMVSLPIFIIGVCLGVSISLVVALFRDTYLDRYVLVMCIMGMSIVYFLFIIGGQFFLGKLLRWFPISGWNSDYFLHFAVLPMIVAVFAGVSADVRLYRTIMVNEINSDYIRTARAKGLSDKSILFKHLLKNAMIPILTGLVMAIPFLFTGALLLENFFGIPGLGRLTVQAIQNYDFPTISAMAYISAVIYIFASILTDISYTLVDPRVRLK